MSECGSWGQLDAGVTYASRPWLADSLAEVYGGEQPARHPECLLETHLAEEAIEVRPLRRDRRQPAAPQAVGVEAIIRFAEHEAYEPD